MPPKDQLEIRQPDSAGRINIGKQSVGKTFSLERQADGAIVLTPVAIIPEREMWLHKNKKAMASVLKGIEQSKRGETVYIGSLAEYADIETE